MAAFRSGVCTSTSGVWLWEGQRAPCEEWSNGTGAAGVGLTGFCLLPTEKHLASTPCSSKQNALHVQHTETSQRFPVLCHSLALTCARVLVAHVLTSHIFQLVKYFSRWERW